MESKKEASKKNITLAALVVAGALFGWGVWHSSNTPEPLRSTESTKIVEQQDEAPALSFYDDGRVVAYGGEEGKAALEILRQYTEVNTQTSEFGDFVTGINGVEAGENEFWAFYVNGELASEGAGTYQTAAGEVIEWKLEAL